MVKIRVYYDEDVELAELISLLSPRLDYIRRYEDNEPKRCYLGIKTDDLLAVLAAENADEASESADFGEDTPIDYTEGGTNYECDQ